MDWDLARQTAGVLIVLALVTTPMLSGVGFGGVEFGPVGGVGASEGTILSDGFEDGDLDGWTGRYSGGWGGAFQVVEGGADGTEYALQYDDNSDHYAVTDFESTMLPGLSFYMKAESRPSNRPPSHLGVSSDSYNDTFDLGIDDGNMVDVNGYTTSYNLSSNPGYHQFVLSNIDHSADTANLDVYGPSGDIVYQNDSVNYRQDEVNQVYVNSDIGPYGNRSTTWDEINIGEYGGQTVSGTVTDDAGTPIENAAVSISNTETGETVFTGETDASGEWSTELEDGDYEVTASKDGYETESQEVTISGDSVTVDFTLSDVVFSLETRDLFQPGAEHGYTVTLEDEGDVTDNATVVSNNTSVLTVDDTEHTLTAANLSQAATVDVTASYTDDDGEEYSVTNEVVVAEPTVENLQILPGGTWRFSAVMMDSFFQALLVALFVGVAAARFTSAFAGLAGSQMVLVIGWFAGYVAWVFAVLGLFVALFIGLNLAANIDYTVRR